MYDDKIMRVTDYSHSRVRPFPIANRASSCENYVTTGNGLKKWHPLQPIISEITTAIWSHCSSRESLYEGSDLRRTHGQAERQKVLPCSGADLQRSAMQQRSRATSSDSAEHRNRTMLIQVGLNELSLISLDRKTVIFERHFKDISFCSQVSECNLWSVHSF